MRFIVKGVIVVTRFRVLEPLRVLHRRVEVLPESTIAVLFMIYLIVVVVMGVALAVLVAAAVPVAVPVRSTPPVPPPSSTVSG